MASSYWIQRVPVGSLGVPAGRPRESSERIVLGGNNGGPVRIFAIVGDTGGPDISNDENGKDDTRINSIMFKKLRISLD